MNVREGIADEDDDYFRSRFLQQRTQGTLGLIRESLGLIENDYLWGDLPTCKKEALHPTLHEGVNLVSNHIEGTFITAI